MHCINLQDLLVAELNRMERQLSGKRVPNRIYSEKLTRMNPMKSENASKGLSNKREI